MGVEFLPICDVLFNVVSLASYFCDVVFDIIAVYTFYKNGHLPWFCLSLIFITFSLLTCQVLSGRWMISEDRHKNISRRKLGILTLIHTLGGGMVWRYSLLFAPIQLEHVKQEMRNLCVLRMIHGFAESMPLLLMQAYIACTSPTTIEEINVISMALSLFNVCWALASFTKNIRSHNVHRLVLTWIGVIFQFLWRLGTISSRVLVLVLYTTVFKYWVFLVVVLHWITMMLWVLSRYATFKSERLTAWNRIVLSFFVSYIHIFCYLNLEEQNTKLKIITFYTIMLVENILLIALWALGIENNYVYLELNLDRTHVFVAVFVSYFLGLVFMSIYYKYFHVRKLSAALNYSPNQEENKPAKRQTSSVCSDNPAVTVFNCALNPALRKKKKLPSRSVPPPPPDTTPFWKEPLPREERTAGDGLSYSRTTSVDDIRQKLQEKRDKQMLELRRIEDDLAAGRIKKPSLSSQINQPIPVIKRTPMILSGRREDWPGPAQHEFQDSGHGSYLGMRKPYPESEYLPQQSGYYPEQSMPYIHNPNFETSLNSDSFQSYPEEFNPGERFQPYGHFDSARFERRVPPENRLSRYPDPGFQDGMNQPYQSSGLLREGVNQPYQSSDLPREGVNQPYQSSGLPRDSYYGYKDSSGDQGDVDEDDDITSGGDSIPNHPQHHSTFNSSHSPFNSSHTAFNSSHPPFNSFQNTPPGRLPLPLPRNRVVIGGYNDETPL